MITDGQNLLTIKDLSAKTRLSVSTLRRLVKKRLIPFFQPSGAGGVLRFPPDAIERACAAAKNSAAGQADEPPKPLPGRRPKWRK